MRRREVARKEGGENERMDGFLEAVAEMLGRALKAVVEEEARGFLPPFVVVVAFVAFEAAEKEGRTAKVSSLSRHLPLHQPKMDLEAHLSASPSSGSSQ